LPARILGKVKLHAGPLSNCTVCGVAREMKMIPFAGPTACVERDAEAGARPFESAGTPAGD